MKKLWYTIKLFFCLIRISAQPKSTAAGIAVADCLHQMGLVAEEVNTVRQEPSGLEVLEKRKAIHSIDLDKLVQYPQGSLGRVYAEHMRRENLDPEFFKKLEIVSDETFLMMHLRQTHDLWHVMTGFGTTVPGELGLQAFMMAQTHSPLAPLLIGGRLAVSSIKNPRESLEILSHVAQGWTLGVRAKPLFGLDWEQSWAKPVSDLRQEYGLTAL